MCRVVRSGANGGGGMGLGISLGHATGNGGEWGTTAHTALLICLYV